MNSIERENENKKRRRVVFWLAGGVTAIVALGLVATGVSVLATVNAASANGTYASASASTGQFIPAAELASFTATDSGEKSAQVSTATTKTPSGTVSVANTTPATDGSSLPTPEPTPTPVPDPSPGPAPTPDPGHSDGGEHAGHSRDDGHGHGHDSDCDGHHSSEDEHTHDSSQAA